MPYIDTADWFNKDDLSDVTIKFGSREYKAHKMIICSQSQYFKKLCGTDAQFAEAGQKVIELKDDDEDAVFAMLQWIYTFEYDTTWQREPRFTVEAFKTHNNVQVVADKYKLPALSELAEIRAHTIISSCTTDTLLALMRDERGCDVLQTMQTLKNTGSKRFTTLLHDAGFLEILEKDAELSLGVIRMLRPDKDKPFNRSIIGRLHCARCSTIRSAMCASCN